MKRILLFLSIALSFQVSAAFCGNPSGKTISFLTFNIWQEGTSVPNGFEKIKDVITTVNPDVVCFVEVRNYHHKDWTSRMVQALTKAGKHYYAGYAGGDVAFISKYPIDKGRLIFSNADRGTIVLFNLHVDGKTLVLAGAHLDYTHYACYLPRGYNGGDPNWKMINNGHGKPAPVTDTAYLTAYDLKSTRDEAVSAFLKAVKTTTDPVILMGDFNEPSCLDWTKKTQNRFDHHGVAILWPVTLKLSKAGFVDVFRTFYPDEVKSPGFTWPSYADDKGSTSWAPLADERDRVDYIFFRGKNIKIENVALVGNRKYYVYNQPDTANTGNETFLAEYLPWPSDHKAVFATLIFHFSNK